jgi:hypothetical protein
MEPSGRNRWPPVANEIRAEAAKTSQDCCRGLQPVAAGTHGKEGGRRFESVRGLCKIPANQGFFFDADLQILQRDAGMEHIMEVPSPDRPAKCTGRLDFGASGERTLAQRREPAGLRSRARTSREPRDAVLSGSVECGSRACP